MMICNRRRTTPRRTAVRKVLWVSLFAAVITAGCASPEIGRSAPRVVAATQDKLAKDIVYTADANARRAVRSRVEELLSRPLTAKSAVQIALLNNQRLQADLALLGIAQADLVQAGLFKNPVFSGTMVFSTGSQRIMSFSIAQDFLDIVLTPLRVSIAEAELAATERHVIASIVGLALQTRQAFVHYQAASQTVELWETVINAQGASYELAERMGVAGNKNIAEITNERILLEQARIDASAAAVEVQSRRERLNQLLGLWGQDVAWTAEPMMPDLPATFGPDADFARDVIANSLELAAGRGRLEAAARRVGLEQLLQALPMIEIGGVVDVEKERGTALVERRRLDRTETELAEVPGSVEWWAGPALTIPLPLFDQGQAARARAVAELQRLWDQLTAHAIELRADARLAAFRASVAHQQAVYYRDIIVPLRHKLTREILLRYNAMSSSPFDMLNAKIGEIQAGRQYIETAKQFWLAEIALDGLRLGVEIDALGNMKIQAGGMSLAAMSTE